MQDSRTIKDRLRLAWKAHGGELIPWAFGLLFYLAIMKQAEPSKFTVSMLVFVTLWPVVFCVRMVNTFIKSKPNKDGGL